MTISEPRDLPYLGVGVGLRPQIEQPIIDHIDRLDWLEVIAEDYLFSPHRRAYLETVRGRLPLVPHGIDLSIGTDGPLRAGHVRALADLVAALDAPWCSDHLSLTRAGGLAMGALVPLHRTPAMVRAVARKARQVQDAVGVPFLVENVSAFIDVGGELSDAAFVRAVVEEAGCWLLLDVTNLFNNAVNHRFDPIAYLDELPLERVVQLHLAGGTWARGFLQDNHRADVHTEVWDLLRHLLPRTAVRGFLIERDDTLPRDFGAMLDDVARTRAVVADVARATAGGGPPGGGASAAPDEAAAPREVAAS